MSPIASDVLEVDEAYDRQQDDGASSLYSDTTSVSSSVKDYVYENGRRYHAYREGKYMLPNDESEQDRLDLVHHFFMLFRRGALLTAPIDTQSIKKILDVGTGTGIWAMEAGDIFPDAEVIGVDLSPIQPAWVPQNVKFQIDDVEEEWTFPKSSFDLIHIRTMLGSIRDWRKLIKQSFDHLAPGGYIELADFDMKDQFSDDGTLKEDCGMKVYYRHLWKALEIAGTAAQPQSFEAHLREVGFTNVVVTAAKTPTKPWVKDARLKEQGRCMYELASGYESYGLAAFTRILQLDNDKAREIIQGAVRDHHDMKIHAYQYTYIVHARKPKSA